MFSDKLNFIMNLTRTQVSALGKACNLDHSYVSRLRNGSRPLPKNAEYFDKMAEYLASRIVTDYQKKTFCDTLKLVSFPEDTAHLTRIVGDWLILEQQDSPDITNLIESFTVAQSPVSAADDRPLPRIRSCYYGADGKREAVLQFFHLVLKENEPRTLLLLGEEDMTWLYEDAGFAARWAAEFTKVLMAGNRVKIIHNIGRGMNDMLEAVAKWLPVYTTGMIEPYYYPRLRDGVFQRTLFIAPDVAAVVSSSVENRIDGMLNQLITDKKAVRALSLEFENYFLLCRPLMSIMTVKDRDRLWKTYNVLIAAKGSMMCMSDSPTLATMPEKVAASMQERAPQSIIYGQWQSVRENLKKCGKTQYTEIVPQFECNLENMPLPCADLLGADGLCYTKDEWNAHIKNSLKYAADHKSYSQVVKPDIPPNICLFVKDGCGVIMTKTNAPGAAFAFSDANMVGAFADYLKRI